MEIAMMLFAGATAVANAGSAYSAYRANNPRRNRTGPMVNYTAAHNGYSMAGAYMQPQQYQYLMYAPVYNVNYHMAPVEPPRSQSYNYAPPPPQQINQRVTAPVGPPRTVSTQVPDNYGGTVRLLREQVAIDTYDDDGFGLSTGRRQGYSLVNAQNHWKSFKRRSGGYIGEARAVAVVNWTKGKITMFVERDMTYYRNYFVESCNVAAFGQKFRMNAIFSGVVKGGLLVASKQTLTIVEDDGACEVDSSNCWEELGISTGPGIREPVFVEMIRGAVFGLICCVHKSPSSMNVDMLEINGVEFVHVDTGNEYLENAADNCFTVFSFGTEGWSKDLVLVG
ncbi:hypothetical protein M758_10G085000 [Ceratodon purpureus]|nr:hypothetical protein M758_10G085000 [Ceratodon purpureus]